MSSSLQVSEPHQLSLCLIAGEASGDAQGALLLSALEACFKGLGLSLKAWGCGGTLLRSAGLETVVDIEQLSAMGFAEVAAAYPRISAAAHKIRSELRLRRPDITILIDYPGLNMRLMEDAYHSGSCVVYHIPPKVWAHGAARIARLRDYTYLVTCILPFEQKLLRGAGVNAIFVGNPLNDEIQNHLERKVRRSTDSAEKKIALIPGSRAAEIEKVFPLLVESFVSLSEKLPSKLSAVVPVAPTVSITRLTSILEEVLDKQGAAKLRQNIVFNREQSLREVVCDVDYAWVCSGTAALEVAFLQVPMAVVYRMNWLSYKIAKRLVRLPHISLVNLCAQREIVPEYVQENATVANLVHHAAILLNSNSKTQAMKLELAHLQQMFPRDSAAQAAHQISSLFLNLPKESDRRFHYKANHDLLLAEREWSLMR
ncbi:MAG: hypothetical protein RJB13_335 [Pseudomonadota bacterium]